MTDDNARARDRSLVQGLLDSLKAYQERDPCPALMNAAMQSINGIADRLDQNRRLTRIAARAARIGGWDIDLASDIQCWSEETCTILRVPPGTSLTVRQAINRFVAPEHQVTLRRALDACRHDGAPFDLEVRIITATGERIWARLIGQALRDRNGVITRIEGALLDITEHKRRDNEIRNSNARYHQLADAVPQLLWTATPDGMVDLVNQAVIDYAGQPSSELLDLQWLALLHPDDVEPTIATWRRALREGRGYACQFRLRRAADGMYRWHAAAANPIRDDAGHIVRWCGTSSDIHDLKTAAESARSLADRLATTLESITDAFFMLDHDSRFTYVNRQAEHLLRRRREELIGTRLWDEFKEALGTEFQWQHERAAAENIPIAFEAFYPPPLEMWLQVHLYPSKDGLAVYFRDSTEQHRLELLQTEQSAIMRDIASGAPLQDVMTAVVLLVERQHPSNLCSVLLLDEDGRHLRLGAAPSFPAEYNQAIEGMEVGPAIGSCGSAAFQRQPVIVTDIASAPSWHDYRDMALQHGLHACWSVPILSGSGEKVLGTVAVYSRVPRSPKPEELDMLDWCARTLSIAIERQKTMQALLENEKLSREQQSLINQARDAIFVRNIDGRILSWNKGAERLYGWTKDEAVGRLNKDLLYDDPAEFEIINQQVLQHDEWNGEITVRRKDGTRLVMDTRLTLVRDDYGKPSSILSINTDITPRKAAEREIHRLAFYDPLTQLPNRQLLLDRLRHALSSHAHSRQFGAVMLLDLDNFKSLNDTQGHDKGDLLLAQVAQRLGKSVREHDTVARWGGDEFVIMLEELGASLQEAAARADAIAEQILAAFQQPFDLHGVQYLTTTSIGVTLFSGETKSIDDILKQADLAMYQAKDAGRNVIRFFDTTMQAMISRRVQMENDIRYGLRHDEFTLHYQPQVDCDGEVAGVEALLRWRHPQRGFISPAEFIPLAEDTGLINELGRRVLETACNQLVRWQAQPETAGLTISVNVSARQFQRADFVDQVRKVIRQSGADPRKLKLELTESLLITDVEQAIMKIHALKSEGIGISLDDFGTGYSSLAYLKRLPLDQLKIDQSFIKDVLTNKDAAAIVATIIALGKSLGFNVMVEGVETEAHHRFLCNYGCDAFQGYLFSKPLPMEQLQAYLARHH